MDPQQNVCNQRWKLVPSDLKCRCDAQSSIGGNDEMMTENPHK